jgi:hypothetical protein
VKITKRQIRRIIREEKARLNEAFDVNDIDMRATDFSLYDAAGDLDVEGDLRDPVALRALADALEGLLKGQIMPNGRVALDLN